MIGLDSHQDTISSTFNAWLADFVTGYEYITSKLQDQLHWCNYLKAKKANNAV